MNENLDLTKILEGCPVGTKFYSTIYGKVDFSRIIYDDYGKYLIELMVYNKYTYSIEVHYCEKDGTFSIEYEGECTLYEGECTLFPSEDQRDWSKFVRFWDNGPKVEKFDMKTLQPFDRVLVRDYPEHDWRVENFGCITEKHKCICTSFWKMCIPYNEETKHLLGTKEDCPEYYKWWEE